MGALTAREAVAVGWVLVREGRSAAELDELEEWLTTDPAQRRAEETAQKLAAIVRLGGDVRR